MTAGSNRGKWHGCRQRRKKPNGKPEASPRLAVSFPDEDLEWLHWLADRRDKPVAQMVRDAVHAWVAPFKNNPMIKGGP